MQSRMILCGILLCASAALATPKSSELHGGQWVDVSNPTTEPAADPELLRLEQMVQDGKNKEAAKEIIIWLKRDKDSPLFDRGLYLEAQALYQYGNRIKAFFYLDELLDDYPDSALYSQALDKQYQIADEFLNGYKRRFLKIPMLSAEEEAVEMMYRLQQRSPGSPLAEKALLRTADFYYSDREYDLAVDAYEAYIKNYPRSPAIPRVKLRQAYANLAQFHGVRFDTTPITDAKAQLEDIVKTYPDLAMQENIPALLEQIDETYARKLAVTADFYRRTSQPDAARYTYEYLEKTYPQSPESANAQRAVAKLPAPTTP
jgi:outer membrane protein assembly factor BamD (BamD/ComL family)